MIRLSGFYSYSPLPHPIGPRRLSYCLPFLLFLLFPSITLGHFRVDQFSTKSPNDVIHISAHLMLADNVFGFLSRKYIVKHYLS